ncbi:MAG: phosphoenolpyruvate synthase [Candidatus Beckwithbacteria bacterium]|nr:phosphoenolpyruvate synthase [Candidatus Beckwithbacteria bacterium]
MTKRLPEVVDFKEVDKHDVGLVGGKGANLGELTQAGFPIPPGFIVTAQAYYRVLEINGLEPKIKACLKNLDHHQTKNLNSVSKKIKQLILTASLPDDLAMAIIKAYLKLGKGDLNTYVAVRSSATAEDLPGASFAGQQETFLNVKGEANLVQNVRACWASLFEPRAIFYRQERGFDHFKVGIAVPVQKMVQSQVSGIMFTINPLTNDKNQLVIEAVYGLGEMIVQGAYTPDHYLIQKRTNKILQKQVNHQPKELVRHGQGNKEVKVKASLSDKPKLTDEQIVFLAKLGEQVQEHYFFPQDIEWALDKGKFYLVQSRPVTTITAPDTKAETVNTASLKMILKGEAASPGMAVGYPRVLRSAAEISKLLPGEILVTSMTTPDFVPAMKKAAAIVTDKGGQTSHAAIVSRELGIPCIVGAKIATTKLKASQVITVNGKTGEVFLGGQVIKTPPIAKVETAPVKPLTPKQLAPDFKATATKLYVNLAEPDLAGPISQKNVDGVGLLRAEFMIAQIGTHPKKMIADGKQKQFIEKLVAGMSQFCHSFSPRPVVYRATDFKTNEYSHLIGGKAYEPVEPNPMLGFRGAFRYLVDEAVFSLELQAIKQVREKLGYTNIHLMIPFVRTVEELIKVKKIVNDHGLTRSHNFQLWLMVEIPSNVVLLEEFIAVGIDGVSIGSNDLTMLMLGVDRDNSEVAPVYDELNPAVLWALEKTIKTSQRHRVTSSICGQAPSLHPELTEKLIKWGITSVSVSPDMIEQTRELIYQAEANLLHHAKNR